MDNHLMDVRLDKLLMAQEQLLSLRLQDHEDMKKLQDGQSALVERMEKVEQIQNNLWKIDTYQQHDLKKAAHEQIAFVIRKFHGEVPKSEFSVLFRPLIRQLWTEYQGAFKVPRYGETRAKQYEAALDWVAHWEPKTKLLIDNSDTHRQESFVALLESQNEVAATRQ